MGETSNARPNPGSPEAVQRGCTCPVIDNAHGKGVMGFGREWWITDGCPIHAPTPDNT